MQNFEKDNGCSAIASTATSETAIAVDNVTREQLDELGLIFLETRTMADGTKQTRKVSPKGWPILTADEAAKIENKYPYDPDL